MKLLDHLEEWLIALLMGAATLVIFIAVAHRYASGLPLPGVQDWLLRMNTSWAQELTIYLFVWMAKFGAAYGVRTGIHVGVDVLVSAPQKGWSASPCCGLVMLSAAARAAIEQTTSTSFAADLKKWLQIMEAYENGGHMYHTTMPTDALARLDQVMRETKEYGFDKVRQEQITLGNKVRALMEARGFVSVAAEGFKAPGVVVSYTTDPEIQNSKKFLALGLQTAAGVPLQCDEPADFSTFRIGLFGLDKLHNPDRSVQQLAEALDKLGYVEKVAQAA